ncbi:MAG TPA: hypothetical protein VE779_14280 [Candidatus Angelobacter sp.]|nr:hypothetical protein [Candidatus Angelobacter sp.]
MHVTATFRKLTTATIALSVVLWSCAGLAQVWCGPVKQCTMTAGEMQAMAEATCCPEADPSAPSVAVATPPCCAVSNVPERPVAFVVNDERVKVAPLDVVAELLSAGAAPAASHFGEWRSAAAPRYVRPVLELKTDLRI